MEQFFWRLIRKTRQWNRHLKKDILYLGDKNMWNVNYMVYVLWFLKWSDRNVLDREIIHRLRKVVEFIKSKGEFLLLMKYYSFHFTILSLTIIKLYLNAVDDVSRIRI